MPFIFPNEAIELLGSSNYDPEATPGYELISGGISWGDERYMEFAILCRSFGCDDYGVLFAYRTSLLKARPLEKYRYAWDEVLQRCPGWIGFRPERVIPTPEIQEFIRDSQDNF